MENEHAKFLELKIEDLEERIAPGVTLTVGIISAAGEMTVVGPAQATGGAVTAFTAITGEPNPVTIANVDANFDC